jgi:hypothetical protein
VQRESDPVATRVLSNGEAIVAPRGRADDFSWPRADANANNALDPAPLVSAPATPPAKGKNEIKKTEAKTQPAPSGAAAKPRPLNPAPPRPPLPVGPSRD